MISYESTFAPRKRAWRWVRVYYHQKCKDALLLNGIWPALIQLEQIVGTVPFYFERSSVGGPNILIGIDVASPVVEREIPSCVTRIRNYVEQHPSARDWSSSQLAAITECLATYEARPLASVPLQDDNVVCDQCEEPSSIVLRPGPLRETTRTFKVQSTRMALDWLALTSRNVWSRNDIALRCLIGLAWTASPDRLRVHASFRSHAEGLFRSVNFGDKLRTSFSANYERKYGTHIRSLLLESVEAFRNDDCLVPGIAQYISLVRDTLRDLHAGLKSGRYQATATKELESRFLHFQAVNLVQRDQPAHRAVPRLSPLLDTRHELRAWQITVNLAYGLLNQLGVTPMERFFTCYCLTRAIEELYGETADQAYNMLLAADCASTVFACFDENDIGGHASVCRAQ